MVYVSNACTQPENKTSVLFYARALHGPLMFLGPYPDAQVLAAEADLLLVFFTASLVKFQLSEKKPDRYGCHVETRGLFDRDVFSKPQDQECRY